LEEALMQKGPRLIEAIIS